jgi:hypothetical protein
MARVAETTSALIIWLAQEEHAARMWRPAGHILILSHRVSVRWDQPLITIHLTTTGAVGISTRSLASVCIFLFLVATSQTDTFYPLGTLFLQRFKTAFVMQKRHESVFEQLSSTFSNDTNKKWDDMVKTWNRDKTVPNPYAEPQCSTFLLFLEMVY